MPPKSERFELRLDEALISKIDHWRIARNDLPSRAEAVRQLVEMSLLDHETKITNISPSDRLMFGILSDIYKHVVKEKHPEYNVDFIMKSIYGGHFWALEWEMQSIFHDHVDSPKTVTEVVDTLDMFSFIEPAYAAMSDADKARIAKEAQHQQTGFIGYDGNNEGDHMAIVRHLVERMNRFQFLKGRDINSHSRKRDKYRRMVSVFEPIRETLDYGKSLTVGELIKILNA